jgi:hypothetical protein
VAEATTFSILTIGLVCGIPIWLYKGQYIYLFDIPTQIST